ncbi:MAG: hypothetical protein V3V53_01240 [Bacteroidales bacterium]
MFLKFLKVGRPVQFMLLLLFAVLFWLKYFILPQPVQMSFEESPMPLFQLVSRLLGGQEFLSKTIALSLLVINALLLSRLNMKFIVLKSRTYLPSFIFLLIVSSYLPLQRLNPVVFASIFMLFAIEAILGTFKKEGLAYEYFLASFLVSTGSLFYARGAYLMLIIWIGLSLFRNIRWREWMFTVIGFLLPYIFLFSLYYLAGQELLPRWQGMIMNFLPDHDFNYFNKYYILFYAFLAFLILLASRKMISNYQGLKIYVRKFYKLNFWIFAVMLIVYFSLYSRSVELVYFSGFAIAYLLSYYFFNLRSKLTGEILFGLLFAGYVMLLITS